jgi:hypothetical protein
MAPRKGKPTADKAALWRQETRIGRNFVLSPKAKRIIDEQLAEHHRRAAALYKKRLLKKINERLPALQRMLGRKAREGTPEPFLVSIAFHEVCPLVVDSLPLGQRAKREAKASLEATNQIGLWRVLGKGLSSGPTRIIHRKSLGSIIEHTLEILQDKRLQLEFPGALQQFEEYNKSAEARDWHRIGVHGALSLAEKINDYWVRQLLGESYYKLVEEVVGSVSRLLGTAVERHR